jgi:hypothetical protein
MRQWRIGLIFIAMHIFLVVFPCSAGVPTPIGGTPDIQVANPPDIVLPPVVYTGPVLDDIGMKLISYTGPDLSDITMDPIHFTAATPGGNPSPALSPSRIKASKAVMLSATRIPGVSPGVKILSPAPGQKVTGTVLLEVKITGWRGTPGVDLSWWWSPAVPDGQWPPTPKSMTVVSNLGGKTRMFIPASTFPQSGLWRVEAAVKVSDNLRVSDDVSFKLAGIMSPPGKAIIMKQTLKKTLPGGTATKPAAGKRIQPRPVEPAVKQITSPHQ